MNSEPLVSVITPTLNSEAFLRETIQSIASQNYSKIEHIVVDGGSTDDTLRILARHPDTTVYRTRVPGMYPAINIGLRAAHGDILCYLNSDDVFSRAETIQLVVRAFQRSPERRWAYGNCDFIDEDGTLIKRCVAPPLSYKVFSAFSGMPIFQPATFWRRECQDLYGLFNETYRLAGDFEYFLRIAKYERAVRIGGPSLANFRVHANSLSSLQFEKSVAEVMEIKRNLGIPHSTVHQVLGYIVFKMCNVHRIVGK